MRVKHIRESVEGAIDVASSALDIYTAASVAATVASGGAALPTVLAGAAGKAAIKGVEKLILRKAATKLAAGAAKQITESATKRTMMSSVKNLILKAILGDDKKGAGNSDVKNEVEYMSSAAGAAGVITYIGALKGASPIKMTQPKRGVTMVTWAISLENRTVLVSVATDTNKKVYVPPTVDINAKAVFNKTEIPLYKLAVIMQGVFNPRQSDIGKIYTIMDIGKNLIGMDRKWLSSAEDYEG